MAISFQYFVFEVDGTTYAVKPDGVSFGENETEEIKINGGADGTITTVNLKKREVTLTVEGVTDADIGRIQNRRDENIRGLIQRNATLFDLNFGGFVVENALITDFTPSAPKTVDGIGIFDSIEVVFTSQVFV